MAGNRILLESGEFTNPEAAQKRLEDTPEKAQIDKLKKDLDVALRNVQAANTQVEKLTKEYADIKKAYDVIWKELNVLKSVKK